jgi:threonine/homoserine/homoserine lactone efflux protein
VGQAIGQSITSAIGVAISPIPIIAIILMLLSKRAGSNSLAFTAGWVGGIAGALTVIILISSSIGTGPDNSPSSGTSTTKVVIGAAILLLGVRYWRKRPSPGEPTELPKWLRSIEAITPWKSLGLGIGLSVVNPKNILLLVAGGLAIAGAPATSGGKVVAAIVFVILAASTVVLPVVLYKILGDRAERSLESLNNWLQANNATVMSVLLLVIGVDLIGKGIGGF